MNTSASGVLRAVHTDRGRDLQSQISLSNGCQAGLSDPPLRVLVVEDERTLSEMISLALLEEGYEVTTAYNGAAALERVQEYRPDVILLDVHMPVMDGPTFAERYRQLPGPHAAIIVFTAGGGAQSWASRLRAAAGLDKPFDVWALADLLRSCARSAPNEA